MSMVIGSNSKSTILEVLQIGVREVVRQQGLPEEMTFDTGHTKLTAKSADFSKQIDFLRVEFTPKTGVDVNELKAQLDAAKIPNQVVVENGHCRITLPSFEWRQLPQLNPVDRLVVEHSAHAVRSQSWRVQIARFKRFDFNINVLIEHMMNTNASDIHLRAGSPPYIRHDGDLKPMELSQLSADDMQEVVFQLGGQEQVDLLHSEKESSFQYHLAGIGFLRCSGYMKMGAMSLAIRFIPEAPLPFDSLDLPESLKKIAMMHRGLFLVCGVTGSGKSTTLASMVDYVNARKYCHIITTEDPIEFVYSDKKSIISQRQVGRDTFSFANALRGALREDPDVILVGEMRDRETIRAALSAASTGHLVFSTLHTMTAVDTVNRIISYFPQAERDVIRQELAYSLVGVCCQRLLKRVGGGRIPCIELLLANLPMVRDAILEGDIERLYNIIEVDTQMRSFDQYAVDLYKAGKVTREEAISACKDEEAFQRVITGIKGTEGRKLLK